MTSFACHVTMLYKMNTRYLSVSWPFICMPLAVQPDSFKIYFSTRKKLVFLYSTAKNVITLIYGMDNLRKLLPYFNTCQDFKYSTWGSKFLNKFQLVMHVGFLPFVVCSTFVCNILYSLTPILKCVSINIISIWLLIQEYCHWMNYKVSVLKIFVEINMHRYSHEIQLLRGQENKLWKLAWPLDSCGTGHL